MQTSKVLFFLACCFSTTLAASFTITAAHVGSAIDLQQIEAAGERLWIGKPTASYCPSEVGGACASFENITAFVDDGDGYLSMAVEVPGGQGIYIDTTCGAVGYTQAHSNALPEGGIVGGWTLDPSSNDAGYGFLTWGNGLFACSVVGNSSLGPWQVYADLTGEEFGDECIGFNALTSNETFAYGAWEYT